MNARFPGRRFSFVRLGVALVATAAVGAAGIAWWHYDGVALTTPATPWFSGYVDATATPLYEFESLEASPYTNVTLAFVVADDDGGTCAASWGGYYTLSEAATELDMDRRIARLAQMGRNAVISFGGRDGVELASACADVDSLASAYREVIHRYDVTVLDFDIEGDELSDAASRQRRAQAVAQLQQEASEDDPLTVWLTLPADADGLTADALTAVEEFQDAGVNVSGVNLMTMDFNTTGSVDRLVIASATAAREQLARAWGYGLLDTTSDLWQRMGVTVMIGQSDIQGEVLTVDDARAVNTFAQEKQLGRVSMWSLNRDVSCGTNYPDWETVTTFCSGVEQTDGEFASVLSDGLDGEPVTAAARPSTSADIVSDDPDTSPYPIWDGQASYPADTRVVWHGNVYVSRWWTQGSQPDLPSDASQNPWRLIGPVLPGETPAAEPTLPADYYPEWSPTTVYHKGDRVMLDGIAYEARWWTQSDSPDASEVDPGSSPWTALTSEQITDLLDGDD